MSEKAIKKFLNQRLTDSLEFYNLPEFTPHWWGTSSFGLAELETLWIQ